jgi:hypothetical protein
MKDQIKQIRELLDELESSKPSEEPSFKESFQLFELPELVASIVDYLQPTLQPSCLLHNSQRNAQPIMDYLTRKQDTVRQ